MCYWGRLSLADCWLMLCFEAEEVGKELGVVLLAERTEGVEKPGRRVVGVGCLMGLQEA